MTLVLRSKELTYRDSARVSKRNKPTVPQSFRSSIRPEISLFEPKIDLKSNSPFPDIESHPQSRSYAAARRSITTDISIHDRPPGQERHDSTSFQQSPELSIALQPIAQKIQVPKLGMKKVVGLNRSHESSQLRLRPRIAVLKNIEPIDPTNLSHNVGNNSSYQEQLPPINMSADLQQIRTTNSHGLNPARLYYSKKAAVLLKKQLVLSTGPEKRPFLSPKFPQMNDIAIPKLLTVNSIKKLRQKPLSDPSKPVDHSFKLAEHPTNESKVLATETNLPGKRNNLKEKLALELIKVSLSVSKIDANIETLPDEPPAKRLVSKISPDYFKNQLLGPQNQAVAPKIIHSGATKSLRVPIRVKKENNKPLENLEKLNLSIPPEIHQE